MAEKKHSAFALLDILITYTDENHILTTKQLQEHLLNKYDLQIERRTLYSNIDILEQAGYQISRYEDNGKGYYLETKQFDKGEVLLLCNAIHASHFISEKESNILIKKLLKTLSKYEAEEYRDNVYMPNPLKKNNDELIMNINIISEAIKDKRCMQFTYMKYDNNKNMIPKRVEPYIIEPRYIVYADSKPYLIATHKNYTDYTHYRIDRISKAFILDEHIKHLSKNKDAYEYARNKLFMYSGKMEYISFLCEESLIDNMIDIFGKELMLYPQKNNKFLLTVSTSRKGAKFLALQFLDALEIIEPKDLKKEFKKELDEYIKKYNKRSH